MATISSGIANIFTIEINKQTEIFTAIYWIDDNQVELIGYPSNFEDVCDDWEFIPDPIRGEKLLENIDDNEALYEISNTELFPDNVLEVRTIPDETRTKIIQIIHRDEDVSDERMVTEIDVWELSILTGFADYQREYIRQKLSEYPDDVVREFLQ